ncbi:E3 ubiquitin-protein ligase RNF217-like isoform X2 [Ptychodera flava]|uniref:E3 ubiquitin-protein ligase RNF217-like isoform X2 n=1 Tax=Ptychodera flava TaxID=63121 RepID=UPI003969BF86
MANEENMERVASESDCAETESESRIESFLLIIDKDIFSDKIGYIHRAASDQSQEDDKTGSQISIPSAEAPSPSSIAASGDSDIGQEAPTATDSPSVRKYLTNFVPRRKNRGSDSESDISDYETFSDIDDFFERPVLDLHFENYEDLWPIMDPITTIRGPSLDPDPPKMPLFEMGKPAETECQICLVVTDLHLRTCCTMPVCDGCLQEYCSIQVNQKIVKVPCPNPQCNAFVSRDEIVFHLDGSNRDKFHRFLLEANKEPHTKTCPRCSHLFALDKEIFAKTKMNPQESKVACPECYLVWCFPCHAPWHEGISCREYKKGDKLLRAWAKERSYGQNNAQRCPKCRVYIQRSSGCDHMTCSRCKTEFCYRCGKQFRSLKFIGDHYSRLSVFGCKYRFKPDNPVQRRMVRGAVLGAHLLAAPVFLAQAAVGLALALAVGCVILPFYGGMKLRRKLKGKKRKREKAQKN